LRRNGLPYAGGRGDALKEIMWFFITLAILFGPTVLAALSVRFDEWRERRRFIKETMPEFIAWIRQQ
jgi:hypothetical protein